MSIINLEWRIATHFCCFLPSNSREQRSGVGILGIAAHRMLVSHPLCRLLVSFAGTKHCCLTAVNRDGALCCPDFPRDRGLKPYAFLPLSRDRPIHYFFVRFAHVVCALLRLCRFARLPPLFNGVPENFLIFGESGGTSRSMPQAVAIATLLPNAKSGIRESNPPPRLGKPMHYRCANAANLLQSYNKKCTLPNFK